MDTQQERLLQLDRDLKSGKNICSSGGVLSCFPSSLKEPFLMQGLGLVVCRQGSFQFSLDNKCASAKAGETLFIHEESWFQVLQETEDVEIFILAYQIEPIRDIIGNSVVSMYMYSKLTPELSCVWNTGCLLYTSSSLFYFRGERILWDLRTFLSIMYRCITSSVPYLLS